MIWECVFKSDGKTIRVENVAGDSGGRTIAGIDETSHPHFPFDNPHPFDIVAAYLADAWKPCRCEDVLFFPLGEVVANFAVNLGLGRSIELLQEAINADPATVPAGGGTAVAVDGGLGPATLSIIPGLDPDAMAQRVDDEADARYRSIATNIPRDRKFLNGWLNRDSSLDHWWKDLETSGNVPG